MPKLLLAALSPTSPQVKVGMLHIDKGRFIPRQLQSKVPP